MGVTPEHEDYGATLEACRHVCVVTTNSAGHITSSWGLWEQYE